tara:strand:+ start:8906 stop:9598 length:693 start_codon:yes stop_codon:yes gene_type:complete
MIKVLDTKLISPEMFWEVVYLPYKFTRTDDINPEGNPSDAQATMYWTHQLYNFCPVDDPDYHQNAGLEASNNKIYLDILNYLEAICPDLPPRENMYASYVNTLKFGDMPGIHVDAPYFVEDNMTVLVYLNAEWMPNWGGETIFYDQNLDAAKVVSLKPGRVVMFDGRIPHTGRAPNRITPYNRYILAYKYMTPETRQKLFVDHEMNGMPPVMDHGIVGFDPKTVATLDLT